MEIRQYLTIALRWAWAGALCVALATLAGYLWTRTIPEVYEARARYLVGPIITSASTNSDDIRVSMQAGQTYRELVRTELVLQQVAETLAMPPESVAELRAATGADWNNNAAILTIRAQSGDPEQAAAVANTIGQTMVAMGPTGPEAVEPMRREEVANRITELQGQEKALELEIESLIGTITTSDDQVEQRILATLLDQRREQLDGIKGELNELFRYEERRIKNQLTLLDTAGVPSMPIAPDTQRIVLTSLMGGLALGLAVMLLLSYLDTSVRTPQELTAASGATYLGGIRRRPKTGGAPQPTAEDYRMIRTTLGLVGDGARSLLITSPERGDGKSELAANLAVAVAQSGHSVLLVETNRERPGLEALLLGDARQDDPPSPPTREALLADPVRFALPVTGVPGLWLLPARAFGGFDGRSPWAGAELRQLLQQRWQTLIFDGAELPSAEILDLAGQVDGVLLVASAGKTSRDHVARAVESLRVARARLLGVVLNRLSGRSAYAFSPTVAEGAELSSQTTPRPEWGGWDAASPRATAVIPRDDLLPPATSNSMAD
jgi:capsular polysaccharide biosynthesis protein